MSDSPANDLQPEAAGALFPALLHASPQPISLFELASGRYIEVNQAWLDFFGYRRDEVIGKTHAELNIWVAPDQRAQMRAILERGDKLRNLLAQCRRRSGEIADIMVTADFVESGGKRCLYACFNDVSALTRAEKLLRVSEERFGRIFEAVPECITIASLTDGVFLEVNPACERIYGYSRQDMVGKTVTEVGLWVEPQERARAAAELLPGQARAFETRFRHKSGRIIDAHCSVTRSELDGEPVLLVVSLDISDRKRAERLQQQSEDRFTKVFQNSFDPVVITTLAGGRYLEVNEAWCRLFGYAREEAIGRSALDLGVWADPEDRQRIMDTLRQGGTVRNAQVRMCRRGGAVLETTMSVDTLEFDGVACAVSVVVDYTEHKRTERLRSLSEERFSKVFRASPNPIVISKRHSGARVDVNDAWLRVFGYTRAEAIGKSLDELGMWVDEAERKRFQAQLKEQGALRQMPLRLRRKSGEVAELLVSVEPIELDGEPHVVSCLDDITERMRAERHIEYLATRDHLTGLPNRLLFSDRLRQAMAKAEREGTRIALLFIDLDQFKDINDSLGHHIGDRLLTEVAERLRGAIRAGDTLARQGGDEFLVMVDGLDDAGAAEAVARKLVEAVAQPLVIEGRNLQVSCSLGISIFPDDAHSAAELMRNADMAMYAVKGTGRDGYQFYCAEMNVRLTQRLAMENQLRVALERGEFELHYQPKIDLHSGAVTGCEALLRWHHPQLGMILPARFIGIAEESRLIVPIGAWVLRSACAQLRSWLDHGMAAVPVAVNLSVQQFDAGLPGAVAAALAEAGIAPHMLEIEITETVMMSNSAAHMDIARRLKELGVHIALDDFGTGYSSLSYLRQMEVDVLKIDQSFVRELPGSTDDRTIIAAITAMASQFRIKVVAEGVESQAQADALRGMNCAEYQGFLFSPAVPQAEFEERFLRAA